MKDAIRSGGLRAIMVGKAWYSCHDWHDAWVIRFGAENEGRGDIRASGQQGPTRCFPELHEVSGTPEPKPKRSQGRVGAKVRRRKVAVVTFVRFTDRGDQDLTLLSEPESKHSNSDRPSLSVS